MILFHDRSSGKYCDPGGVVDPGETRLQCAQKELREESLGLFRIDLTKANSTEVKPWTYYSSFVVAVQCPGTGIHKDMYDSNKAFIDGLTGVPREWRETDGMTRFYVDTLVAHGVSTARGDLDGVPDVYGTLQNIQGRAKGCIRDAIALGLMQPAAWTTLRIDAACAEGVGRAGTPLNAQTRGATKCYTY